MGMIGAAIRTARESRGMTAEQLAARVGVTANTVLRWERDEMAPSQDRLQAVADVLGMRLRFVVEFLPVGNHTNAEAAGLVDLDEL